MVAKRLAGALICASMAIAVAACGERAASRAGAPDETLFLAGVGELWKIDVAAERVERIGLPAIGAGDPPHLIAPIGDRLALWNYDITSVPMADPSADPTTLAKHGWIFIPAANPDRIWVGFLDPKSPATERGLGELREIGADGEVITRGVVPPGGAWPYAEVGGGLLFQAPRPTLWDPDTGRTLRTWDWQEIGDMGPVSGDLLASDVYKSGELILTDVTTGDQRRIAAPDGYELVAWEASFSPDGNTLAVPIVKSGNFGKQDQELALVAVDTGEIELVPGSRVPPGYVFTAWSRDGEELFLTGGDQDTPRRIVAYRLGEERAQPLDVDVGDFYDIAAE